MHLWCVILPPCGQHTHICSFKVLAILSDARQEVFVLSEADVLCAVLGNIINIRRQFG